MHKLITFKRIIIAGTQNFVRNAWLSVAAVAVMIVALTISLGGIVLNITSQNAIKEISKDIKVSIYFQDEYAASDREKLKEALYKNPAVVSVEYITRTKAQERLKSDQDQGFVDQSLALLGSEALPESFDVSVNNLEKLQSVADIAKESRFKNLVGQGKDDISLGKTSTKQTVARAVSAKRFITLSSIVASAIFGFVSILIILNTIRMAIFSRQEEIKIMKLIGATPSYIRGPFIVEAVLDGLIAGLAANAVVLTGIFSLGNKLADQREFAETYQLFTRSSTVLMMIGGAIAVGIFVATFSSLMAMRKHLRLKHW